MTTEEPKKSKVELIKEASVGLRGSITAELADKTTDHVVDATTKLLKFHGTYQQDDRDLRKSRRKEGLGKAYSFMVRNRIPGGKMTAAQFLGELDIADELGNGTIRITTRQSIQLHGVVKNNLWDVIHRINEIKLSTQSACGDVTRNVCCCPAPLRQNGLRDQLQQLADEIAVHVRPKTAAYHEIWIKDPDTGEREQVVGPPAEPEPDPIYGKAYLPRKFKIALALCDDNCIDIYDNDVGLLGVTEGDKLIGFNVLAGGGMGTTPSKKNCFPALAKRLTFVETEHLLPIITAIILVQRDFGNRADRSQARLKYTIHNMGLPAFKRKVEEYLSEAESICGVPNGTLPRPLPAPRPDDVTGHDDHMGWHEQGDGKWFLGLPIENGRVKDEGDQRLKTAFRLLFSDLVTNCRLTAQQNILLCDIEPSQRETIQQVLADHGVVTVDQISNARRFSFACPALPTCGLAVTESERALPGVIDDIEAELSGLGLADEQFSIRMTGCPNGCARPYNSDVGLVGRSMDGKTGEGRYTIFLGGNLRGNRMAEIYKDQVPRSEIASTLRSVFFQFKESRGSGESFGEYCERIGVEELAKNCEVAT
ncbi:NADPH-dependent assimilatory sulfite reductase hemoprotein subunit [Rhodopirellula sallentina]|uniref:Sulfite reductase [NADPH] hemoprotein beta subunit n=1 Tax=Rhodopirellula sallentina SM41 TaxID=1263870 RepID=M5UAJ4_9BACT|nr:NADPH-dependent assimilatory sulfite reductase hemoprotein subunit [Rhodopirellula sallentina]EMI54861.1 sulfite reductase [NADPH] hemoprotein beta subunit [Rhodopirellula sallentina SM41]